LIKQFKKFRKTTSLPHQNRNGQIREINTDSAIYPRKRTFQKKRNIPNEMQATKWREQQHISNKCTSQVHKTLHAEGEGIKICNKYIPPP
jgi:hypothetical protein